MPEVSCLRLDWNQRCIIRSAFNSVTYLTFHHRLKCQRLNVATSISNTHQKPTNKPTGVRKVIIWFTGKLWPHFTVNQFKMLDLSFGTLNSYFHTRKYIDYFWLVGLCLVNWKRQIIVITTSPLMEDKCGAISGRAVFYCQTHRSHSHFTHYVLKKTSDGDSTTAAVVLSA